MKKIIYLLLAIALVALGYFLAQEKTDSTEEAITEIVDTLGLEETEMIQSNEIEEEILFNDFEEALPTNSMEDESLLYFSEVWEWDYVDADGNEGSFQVFREPNLNYWLIHEGSLNVPMIEWFLLKPNGEVITAYIEAEFDSKPQLDIEQWDYEKFDQIRDDYTVTGEYKDFGDPQFGYPIFNAQAYELSIATYIEPSKVYLADTDADMTSLYQFNNVYFNSDAKLPFDFPPALPGNKVALSQTVHYGGRAPYSYSYKFKYITPAVFYVDFSQYNQ